tara:strand:- start:64 stop:240 length:177 start_codon:yes stop_codon:yes gene_type:complete
VLQDHPILLDLVVLVVVDLGDLKLDPEVEVMELLTLVVVAAVVIVMEDLVVQVVLVLL